jgi:hypothetical protein
MVSTTPTSVGTERTTARSALLLAGGAFVVAAATTVVALVAQSVDAGSDFPALKPAVYLSLAIVGLLLGYVGWRIVRSRATRPARILRLLVPALLLLSLIPDIVLLVTGFIPGMTATSVIALMLMHLIVVAVGVPLFQRIAPVTS